MIFESCVLSTIMTTYMPNTYVPNTYVLYLQNEAKDKNKDKDILTQNPCPEPDAIYSDPSINEEEQHVLIVNHAEIKNKMQRRALELKLIIFDATACFTHEKERSTLYMTKIEKFDHRIKLLEIERDLLKLEKELYQIECCL